MGRLELRRVAAGLLSMHLLLAGCGDTKRARPDVPAESATGEGGDGMVSRYRGKVALIVNGDDVGANPIFTDATIDAYRKGAISSASIIAAGRDAARAIELLKKYGLPVGVHLTLTGDWEPLTDGPSLRNEQGTMWATSEEAARAVVPQEASREWDAQIRRVLSGGVALSHLDAHMGCYFATSQLFEAAYELARRYEIPLVSPYIPAFVRADQKPLFPLSTYGGIYRLAGKAETLENRAQAYREMIGALGPGIHYIYSHHGWLLPDGTLTGDLDLRIDDYRFWTSPETREWLDSQGYLMIGCEELRKDFAAALKRMRS